MTTEPHRPFCEWLTRRQGEWPQYIARPPFGVGRGSMRSCVDDRRPSARLRSSDRTPQMVAQSRNRKIVSAGMAERSMAMVGKPLNGEKTGKTEQYTSLSQIVAE